MILNVLKKTYIFLIICCFSSNVFAFTISCERTSASTKGFKNYSAMESWYPPNVVYDASEFEKKSNSKIVVITTKALQARIGLEETVMINLLPNGKMLMQLKGRSGYQDSGVARYKCSHNANDVKEFLDNPAVLASNENSIDRLAVAKDMFEGHREYPLCVDATWEYEGKIEFWSTDSDDDFRGDFVEGSYAALLAKHLNYDCNVGKSDKDLIFCLDAVWSNSTNTQIEWYDSQKEEEAKERGLTCGVGDPSFYKASNISNSGNLCTSLKTKMTKHIETEQYDKASEVMELIKKSEC